MCRVEIDTPFVMRMTGGVWRGTVFKLDLKNNTLKVYNDDGHVEIKQTDIAALLDFLQPFDYRPLRQTYFTYIPMDITRLTSQELVAVASSCNEEMVAFDVCIYDKWTYGGGLGETKAEALYLKESRRFGIVCLDYGFTHWLTNRSLEEALRGFVGVTEALTHPGWERVHGKKCDNTP